MNWLTRLFASKPATLPAHWAPDPTTAYDKDGVIPERCEPIKEYMMGPRSHEPRLVDSRASSRTEQPFSLPGTRTVLPRVAGG